MMKNAVPILLALHLGTLLIGAFSKIMHYPFANSLITVGLIAYLAFLILSMTEVFTSAHISKERRTQWLLILLLTGSLGGLLYVFTERRRWQNL